MQCRQMSLSDLPAVLGIQNELGFQNWSLKQFETSLSSSSLLALVCELGEELVAYLLVQILGEEAELLSIAVQLSHKREGIGSRLWNEGLLQLKEKGVQRLFLEVREGNSAAQSFYKNHQFINYGIRKRYYSDGENALLFRFDF